MTKLTAIRVLFAWLAFSAAMPAQQYVFRAYRQAEGLKNLAVKAMATDRDGVLWVATENGVYRFLGSSFQRFGADEGIAGVDIRDVYAEPHGILWVGTDQNLFRWDGRRFIPAGSTPIPIETTHQITQEDDHHLLVVSRRRVYRLEHDSAGNILSYLPVYSDRQVAANRELAQTFSVSVVHEPFSDERIWMGCGKKLYSLLDHSTGVHLQTREETLTEWGADKGVPSDRWLNVHLDRGGTLWAEGLGRIAVLPPGAKRFVDRSIPGRNPENSNDRTPLIEDPQGRMLASAQDGVARWDGTGWQVVGRANGIEHNSTIVTMAFDQTGDLWLGSRGGGVYQWAGYDDWEGWGFEQGLPSPVVWSILPIPGNGAFVGTDNGPALIDGKANSARPLFKTPHWAFGPVIAINRNPDGSLFAATMPGWILRIDPRTGLAQQTAKLPANIVQAFLDPAGRAFVVTDQGVFLRASTLATFQRAAVLDAFIGTNHRVEAGCMAPDGTSWFVANNRLLHFVDGSWSMPPIDGLPALNGSLLAISCARDGALWVTGEQAGVWKLTPGNGRLRANQLELPKELQSLAYLAILSDRRGWIWLGSDAGVVVWNGQSWRHLTQETGLIWNDISQAVLGAGPDGSVWIGTSGGASHLLHPEHVFDPVRLGVSVQDIRRGNDVYTGAQRLTLPWSGKPLHFLIASPATRNRSELILKIWMVGLYPDWIDTQSGQASFSNLPPGDYTFMAKACNPSLQACSDTVKVPVRILPPWWKSTWFYLLCGLAFLVLLGAGDRWRAGQLRQRSRDLESLVLKRTEELEASREQLRIQATHDGLTGMLNRTAVLRFLPMEMERARRENRTVVVALADLDHFKYVNDTYGHLAGDEALRWFAAAVGAAIRNYDHAGRYGGEEFLMILASVPGEVAEQRLAALHGAISNLKIQIRNCEFELNCSLGAAVFDPALGTASV